MSAAPRQRHQGDEDVRPQPVGFEMVELDKAAPGRAAGAEGGALHLHLPGDGVALGQRQGALQPDMQSPVLHFHKIRRGHIEIPLSDPNAATRKSLVQ